MASSAVTVGAGASPNPADVASLVGQWRRGHTTRWGREGRGFGWEGRGEEESGVGVGGEGEPRVGVGTGLEMSDEFDPSVYDHWM